MRKLLGAIFLILIFLFVVIFFTKDIIVQKALSAGFKAFTGLELETGSIDLGFPKTLVSVQDLKLLNPQGFSDKVMLDMPEIYIDYDLEAILQKKIHLEDIRINMKEFSVIRNKDGKLNLDSLKAIQVKKKPAEEQKKERAQLPKIKIDKLRLTVGKVVFKDYSTGGAEPTTREFNVNLDERFENILDPYALCSTIIVKALSKTTIASLANFDLSGLQKDMNEMVEQATTAAQERVQNLGAEAQKAAEDVTKSLSETGQELKETFKLPLGK